MNDIKLEPETIEVLGHFAKINPSIVVRPGGVLRTMNHGARILAKATVPQTFDRELAILDLWQLLPVVDPTIIVEEERLCIRDCGREFSVPLAKPEGLHVPPDKDPKFEVDTEFVLSWDVLKATLDMANEYVVVSGTDGKLMLATTKRGAEPDDGVCIGEIDREFRVVLATRNLREMLPGDYRVRVGFWLGSDGLDGIAHFVPAGGRVEYWVGLAADSEPSDMELRQKGKAAEAERKIKQAELEATWKANQAEREAKEASAKVPRPVRYKSLLYVLNKYGVTRAEVEFDGSGDSGQIVDTEVERLGDADPRLVAITVEETALFKKDYPTAGLPSNYISFIETNLPRSLNDFIVHFAYEVLDEDCDGYENNDGGFGTVTIVPPTGEIKVEMNARFTDSELHTYYYSMGTVNG
jgi:hypothetical protein